MRYYKTDETKGKRWGALAALLYLALWVVLMIFIKFPVQDITMQDEGILINFGNTESAGGDNDTRMTDDITQVSQPQTQANTRPAQIAPSPNGDVEVEQPKPKPQQNPEPVQKPRQPDPRSQFPGRTAGSTSTSEGTSTGSGNQGNPAGTPDGSHSGTGTGTSGTSFDLAGRNTAGALPKPDYNSSREGRVVVEITVNSSGAVTNAAYRAAGSTGVDNVMIQDALSAARKAKFNAVEGENLQAGTITYIFKIK